MSTFKTTGEPTLAWLFYGQYRTGDYCLPWIKNVVDASLKTRATFCSTKINNTYPNALGDVVPVLTTFEATEQLKFYFPDMEVNLSLQIHKQLDPSKGHWHYARMIWSMNKVLQMYNAWAEQNGDVDILVLSRLDTLIGPHPMDFGSYMRVQRPTWRDLYTSPGVNHFVHSELGAGIGDLLIAGSPTAINCVLSYAADAIIREPNKAWTRFRHGPNILFKDAADASSLIHKVLPVKVAVVRPNADLSRPALESFDHHQKFWMENHNSTLR